MSRNNGASKAPSAAGRGGHRKRLREKFSRAGAGALNDYEVLELLLTYAVPRKDVKPPAKELIKKCGGLDGVFEADCKTLTNIDGVGPSAAMAVSLVRHVAALYLQERPGPGAVIKSPRDAVNYVKTAAKEVESEALFAVYLNAKNEVLGAQTLLSRPPGRHDMRARAMLESAFKHNARSVIVAHLMPAGSGAPAPTARLAAEELQRAASTVDLLLHDYLVIGRKDHFSARENGWLKA